MPETVFAILGGIVTLLGAAIPIYLKVKAYNEEKKRKVFVAPDSPERAGVLDRLHKRFPNIKKGG